MKKSGKDDLKIAFSLLDCTNTKFTAGLKAAGKAVKMDKKSETFDVKLLNSLWVKLLFILFSFRGYDPVLRESLFPIFQKIKEYWIKFKAYRF